MDDFQNILENGINFGRGGDKPKDNGKVKTKAKKKQYITGAHGSGSARQKAKYREQRALRIGSALFYLDIQLFRNPTHVLDRNRAEPIDKVAHSVPAQNLTRL